MNINEIKWTKNQLWKGCILASIAHAIMVAHYPELSNEHSWDGMNYSVQDSSGTRGTITFHPQYCIGAFRNEHSSRILGDATNYIKYFQSASDEIVKLAEAETLQYLLDKVDEKILPVITTAFWGYENKLFTIDSFEDMWQNGGFLLERQISDFNSAVNGWIEYYDMSDVQVSLLKSIYVRKIANPKDKIILSKDEIDMIESREPEGLKESKISFEEINITFEVVL
ncbi:hypothetical protein [Acetivibrio clariflavus]|uniref:Uncharacterized protein n=1 Tax=Acetivibrio clariflavus (strain DSM 19732 / NBRC 101661 / EBR45) TaxID=720554 RepID=G8LVW9_ACECE|nr:hypothetical protein [Acetivibrio clariflavus]AEV67536.1 hypothetical protein Clocl_0848 [Acetivibrio clariflavus DSM 19732]